MYPVAGDAAGKGGKVANEALGYTDEAADFLGDLTKHGDDFKRVVDPPKSPKPSIDDSIARANKQVSSNDTKAWLAKGESNATVYRGVEGDEYTYVGKTRQDLDKRKVQHNSKSNPNQKHFDDLENIFNNGEKPLTDHQAKAVE